MWRASLNILSHNHLHCYLISFIMVNCPFYLYLFLFELWYFCFPPQDPHDPEYLSNPPHLAFVFGLTATNSALHMRVKDTDTNTTRKRTYIKSRNVQI